MRLLPCILHCVQLNDYTDTSDVVYNCMPNAAVLQDGAQETAELSIDIEAGYGERILNTIYVMN
jgi:hypothetical protein